MLKDASGIHIHWLEMESYKSLSTYRIHGLTLMTGAVRIRLTPQSLQTYLYALITSYLRLSICP